ncbi:hypothetical protein ACRALDRAFT_208251 [Sodiomyces alcalophilus JCM 7366]|uniref:uncharacterized protein n=1 Tax=Sodiomyces alcalophilus JCM 7366 TaxID=591952 RepID=UPI0039B6BF66
MPRLVYGHTSNNKAWISRHMDGLPPHNWTALLLATTPISISSREDKRWRPRIRESFGRKTGQGDKDKCNKKDTIIAALRIINVIKIPAASRVDVLSRTIWSLVRCHSESPAVSKHFSAPTISRNSPSSRIRTQRWSNDQPLGLYPGNATSARATLRCRMPPNHLSISSGSDWQQSIEFSKSPSPSRMAPTVGKRVCKRGGGET